MVVLQADVECITQWGMEAGEDEICGVLLTRSDGGPRLAKVPNKSDQPRRNIFIESDDFMDALLELVGPPDQYPGDLTKELVVWHTHPGGLVGPSKLDMAYRSQISDVRCLVVTIPSGEAVQF